MLLNMDILEHDNELQNFNNKAIWFDETCYDGNLEIIKTMIAINRILDLN